MTTVAGHQGVAAPAYADDELLWGGRPVSTLSATTPFYAYDRARIAARIEAVRHAFGPGIGLLYAVKANPMPALVGFIAPLVEGLDVASAGELEIARPVVADGRHISFAGPGKRDSELRAAIAAGVTISVESAGELRRLAALATELECRPSVVLRVNPDFDLTGPGVKMGGRPSPFGIDADEVPAVLASLADLPVVFQGFHVYAWSQSLVSDAIAAGIEQTAAMLIRLAEQAPQAVSVVNLGGGLGIPYFPQDRPIDLARVGGAAADAAAHLRAALGAVDVVFELGRYLVGEAGIYVCRVVDTKVSRGRRFVVVDGGLNHHLAASGNFGQVIRRNYPLVAVRRQSSRETVSVVGPLCTPLDLLGDNVELDKLAPGALVAILQSGAYGPSASPQGFLSHPAAAEVLV